MKLHLKGWFVFGLIFAAIQLGLNFLITAITGPTEEQVVATSALLGYGSVTIISAFLIMIAINAAGIVLGKVIYDVFKLNFKIPIKYYVICLIPTVLISLFMYGFYTFATILGGVILVIIDVFIALKLYDYLKWRLPE